MSVFTVPLGDSSLPAEVLKRDKSECRKVGPCGLGQEALYIGSRYLSRFYYIPWNEIRRVFKRVAMSAGGFSGRGVFGAMAYFVVQYGNGREKQCYFRQEADVDRLLDMIRLEHPRIPTYSAAGEKALAEAEEQDRKRFVKNLSAEAENAVKKLKDAKIFLDTRPELSRELSAAAKQKRIVDRMPASARVIGAVVGILGIAAALYGVYRLMTGSGSAMYFLLGGAAAFFFVYSASIFPGKWNSRKYAQSEWEAAVLRCQEACRQYGSFPVPPQYAHTVVLERMIRVIREGRAAQTGEALEVVKADLKALNADVTVSQAEHDEVVEIKPMFLICDYSDEMGRYS